MDTSPKTGAHPQRADIEATPSGKCGSGARQSPKIEIHWGGKVFQYDSLEAAKKDGFEL